MIEPRAIADRNDQGIVDLIGLCAVSGEVAFHQRGGGRVAELQQRAGKHRGRCGAAGDMDDVQRLRQRHAVGDLDHDAIRHHRAVQRRHRIGILQSEQPCLQRGVAGEQRLAQRMNGQAFFQAAGLGKRWREHPVDQHQPAHAVDRMQLQGGSCARKRRRIGCCGQRQHLAHQRAQIGVFPVLDPPVRQANARIGIERQPPLFGDLAGARQAVAREAERIAQRVSGIGFCQCNVHHQIRIKHQAASSNWA